MIELALSGTEGIQDTHVLPPGFMTGLADADAIK